MKLFRNAHKLAKRNGFWTVVKLNYFENILNVYRVYKIKKIVLLLKLWPYLIWFIYLHAKDYI